MDKHVIVTGASRGLGRALCWEFAKSGYSLVGCARSKDLLDELRREIEKQHPVRFVSVGADLTSREGRKELTQVAAGVSGTVVGLVNNAGFGTAGHFEKIDVDREVELVRLNVEAVVELCHHWIPRLRGVPEAFIMNVASTAGFQPVPLFATYSASKAFVLWLSEALAEELVGAGIHVIALCPGATETGFDQAADVSLPPGSPSAEEVAEYALKALRARKRVAVHGAFNTVRTLAARLAPRAMVVKTAHRFMRPWFKHRTDY